MKHSNFNRLNESNSGKDFDIADDKRNSDFRSFESDRETATLQHSQNKREPNSSGENSGGEFSGGTYLSEDVSNDSTSSTGYSPYKYRTAQYNRQNYQNEESSDHSEYERFSGKKSAYGSKVSYVTRFFDDDTVSEKNDLRVRGVENERVYLPRFCLSSIYPKSGASLIYAGLTAAFRIYFRERDSKGNLQGGDTSYVSPFVLSPFVKNNRFIKFVSARKQVELDSWLLDKETLSWLLCKNSADSKLAMIDADKCIFETALYGQSQKLDEGSGRSPALASADHFARQVNCPLILVLDAGESIAQLIPIMKGQMSYARPTLISAVILNRINENNYAEYKDFLERELNLPVLGYLPYDEDFENLENDYYNLTSESRHEYKLRIQKLAETVLKKIDLDSLYSIAEKSGTLNSYISRELFQVQKKLGSETPDINIGYAKDEAFDNSSLENLYLLSELGINLIPVSPLDDDELRDDIDGLYLSSNNVIPFRKALSDNRKFNKSIQYSAKRGLPIFAEEEAYLYICSGFTLNYENVFWPMCSLSSMRLEINQDIDKDQYEYISLTNAVNNPIAGIHWTIKSVIKSYLLDADSGNATKVRRERSRQTCHMAYANSNIFAAASRISFVSEPRTLLRFVSACLNYRDEKLSRYENDSAYNSSYGEARESGADNMSSTIPYDSSSASRFDTRRN